MGIIPLGWETIAIYESGEFVDPRTLDYLVSHDFQIIEDLDSYNLSSERNIYSVGYIITEYIITSWGVNKFIELINQNGDIPSVLGISISQFEIGWKNYTIEKYL